MGITIRDYMDSSMQAKNAWDKKTDSPTNGFTRCLYAWRMINKSLIVDKENIENEIAEIMNISAPSIANERAKIKRDNYQRIREADVKRFSDNVNTAADMAIAEVDKTISKTSDPELVSMIHDLDYRTDISDREWIAKVRRVNEANDYGAMRMLAEKAIKFGRSYRLPYDADEIIRDIEKARADLLHMATIIDKPEKDWTYQEMLIAGEYDHLTAPQERFQRLDSKPGVAVQRKKASLVEQLKEAEHMANECKDYNTANAIRRFLYDRAEYIDNQQIVADYYRSEAEDLISKAKSAMPTRNDDE